MNKRLIDVLLKKVDVIKVLGFQNLFSLKCVKRKSKLNRLLVFPGSAKYMVGISVLRIWGYSRVHIDLQLA